MKDHDVVSLADLRTLAAAEGPCITLAASIPTPDELSARLKNGIRALEEQVKDASLLRPIEELSVDVLADPVWGNTLLLYRSRDLFLHYWVRSQHADMAVVSQRFQVRPLLSLFTGQQQFYLLALSRGNVRLFECTPHTFEPVDLKDVPRNLEEWQHNRQPDHTLENRATVGPSLGNLKGVLFGSGKDREHEVESYKHFWKDVDRHIQRILQNNQAPLLLAGVDEEVAAFRQLSTYPHLLEQAVHGAPDGLPDQELRDRALAIALHSAPDPFRKALEEAGLHRERGSMTTDANEIIKAAFEGRVANLFMKDSAERLGVWDEAAFEPRLGKGEDLLNAAAVETIRHGGRAFELTNGYMPVPNEIAAVLRF
jgi:hypothetical protein